MTTSGAYASGREQIADGDDCGVLVIDRATHEAGHAARRCLNCGHESPHVQQDGDECFCGCVDYAPAKPEESS